MACRDDLSEWHATHCSLGYVVPTLTPLRTKLRNMDLQSTGPLRDSLLRGIDTRFGHCFQDKEFIVATVTNPRFKLSWLDDADARARCTQKLEAAIRASASLSSWWHIQHSWWLQWSRDKRLEVIQEVMCVRAFWRCEMFAWKSEGRQREKVVGYVISIELVI